MRRERDGAPSQPGSWVSRSWAAVVLIPVFFVLAFALGSRDYVSNLLARRELERLDVGDEIEVDGIRGTIIATHSTSVEISTPDGTALIPASRFASGIVKRTGAHDDQH